MLLAIDTATNVPSLALMDEHGVLGEVTWRTRENHTRSLMPEMTRLMELLGVNINQVRAIAVATGPGSFTGLRIGLSAAKGLAHGLSAALLGVPTLDIAAAACSDALPVCAIISAGRARYAAAMYLNENHVPRRTGAYWFGNAETLTMQIAQNTAARFTVVGEVDAALREPLHDALGERVVFASEALNLRRAGFLAMLAFEKWQAGYSDDIPTLAPYYIPTASLA